MRYLKVCLLTWDGNTEWRLIPWGKKHLDLIRKEGHIIMSFIEYHWWQILSLMLSLSLALSLLAYTMDYTTHTHHNAFCRIWTYDTSVRSRLLYSTELRKQVLRVGFEPTNDEFKARCLTAWRPQSGVPYGNWTHLGGSTNHCLNH